MKFSNPHHRSTDIALNKTFVSLTVKNFSSTNSTVRYDCPKRNEVLSEPQLYANMYLVWVGYALNWRYNQNKLTTKEMFTSTFHKNKSQINQKSYTVPWQICAQCIVLSNQCLREYPNLNIFNGKKKTNNKTKTRWWNTRILYVISFCALDACWCCRWVECSIHFIIAT